MRADWTASGGHVPVARPRTQGAQRDGPLVAPPRRIQEGLSDAWRFWLSRRCSSLPAQPSPSSGARPCRRWARCRCPAAGRCRWRGCGCPDRRGAAASFLGMWIVMMVAMMLPSLLPMLWRYRQTVGRTGETRLGRLTALVGVGYFFVWTVFGMAAFPLGVALAAIEMQQPALARAVPIAVGVVVLIAGA